MGAQVSHKVLYFLQNLYNAQKMCSENGMSFRTMDICYGNETINLRHMNLLDLSEQEIIRRGSLEEMRKMGIDPYPAAEYKVNAYTTEIKSSFLKMKMLPASICCGTYHEPPYHGEKHRS